MKHFLITGGAGFIGSHLAERLLSTPDTAVTIIDNFDDFYSSSQKQANLQAISQHPHFQLIEAPVTHQNYLTKILQSQRFEAIIHLAAKAGVRNSIHSTKEYYDTNVMGTLSMLEIARTLSVKKFIYASSSSIYGENPNVPWKETDTDLQPISPYASSKISGEMLGRTYAHLHGIQFLALRFFTVYGSRQRPDLAIHKFTDLILNAQPIVLYGDGSTQRDYTHISDIITGIERALQYEGSGFESFNLASGKPVTLRKLVSSLEIALGREAIYEHKEEQPGDVSQTYADLTKSRQLLGYEPTVSLEDGLREFVQWKTALPHLTI
ncbi:GDP-mannose 4,6-dehydratase [Siphonobacter sp. SORGH_AS_1065]|uniref:GDP-mannose 4,6-dehydratase n=1 Tax=Siphonobacter sp. SORGH_AS_1065 TaxID=3041795 RepID=UPI00278687A0|nr:GDP-mannose 4,6-dehydratase [Siphonobacter sp. SORGH_AS_1065]MDQ1089412.1 UDP-glucuronate 4-epimerase [Siphonobacter sp. SORGH_AS_1065]